MEPRCGPTTSGIPLPDLWDSSLNSSLLCRTCLWRLFTSSAQWDLWALYGLSLSLVRKFSPGRESGRKLVYLLCFPSFWDCGIVVLLFQDCSLVQCLKIVDAFILFPFKGIMMGWMCGTSPLPLTLSRPEVEVMGFILWSWNLAYSDSCMDSMTNIRKFPGGPVVGTLCFHCWGPGSIPGQGTKISKAWWGLKMC